MACRSVRNKLRNCTLQDKRLVLGALDAQVIATDDRVEIKAAVPLEYEADPLKLSTRQVYIGNAK